MHDRNPEDITKADPAPQMEMPRYVSHKKIWALEISSVTHKTDGGGDWILEFADKGYAPKIFSGNDDIFARYKPVAGDFYVVYQDGYKSFSPRKAFLEGYTREGSEK
jgi:hypothetical protein